MQNTRIQRIQAEIEELKIQPNLKVMSCEPDDLIRQDLWIVWVQGQKGSPYEGGFYPVRIQFPDKYPLKPPTVNFDKEFQHIHVYQGGAICLPILDQVNWKPKMSMTQIIRRIHALMNQQINPYSPANASLFKVYTNDILAYKAIILEQAKAYSKKSTKYFLEPSIHIEIINNSKDD